MHRGSSCRSSFLSVFVLPASESSFRRFKFVCNFFSQQQVPVAQIVDVGDLPIPQFLFKWKKAAAIGNDARLGNHLEPHQVHNPPLASGVVSLYDLSRRFVPDPKGFQAGDQNLADNGVFRDTLPPKFFHEFPAQFHRRRVGRRCCCRRVAVVDVSRAQTLEHSCVLPGMARVFVSRDPLPRQERKDEQAGDPRSVPQTHREIAETIVVGALVASVVAVAAFAIAAMQDRTNVESDLEGIPSEFPRRFEEL
mmetsp:Transcript_9007/g.20644  ORF Transcript_9007/g.20644 Transcript_9007/m.20644 type:complete len:251 (-) Transcript_9007:42-794(-)